MNRRELENKISTIKNSLAKVNTVKLEHLKCERCGCNEFTYHGQAVIGGVLFNGYVCVKCYNGIADQVIR